MRLCQWAVASLGSLWEWFFPKEESLPDCLRAWLQGLFPGLDLDRVHFHNGLPPLITASTAAITLPGLFSLGSVHIYFRDGIPDGCDCGGLTTLAHEMVHVRQYLDWAGGYGLGFLRAFMIAYLSCAIRSYEKNLLELEAYEFDAQVGRCCNADRLPCDCRGGRPVANPAGLSQWQAHCGEIVKTESSVGFWEAIWECTYGVGLVVGFVLALVIAIIWAAVNLLYVVVTGMWAVVVGLLCLLAWIWSVLQAFWQWLQGVAAAACQWSVALEKRCAAWEDQQERRCKEYKDQGYQACREYRDQGYNACHEYRDDGYSACKEYRDQGYNACCTWWPCSWGCKAYYWVANVVCVSWYWVANLVCVSWYWVANIVCVAWYWVANVVCVAWTWVVSRVCRAFTWVVQLVTCW